MFVEDCAEAIKRVTEFGKIGEVYNIGIDFEKSNLEVTKIIHHTVAKLLKRPQTEPQFITIPDRPYHDRRYHIDFSKINRELGWQCTTPFSVGFALTIEYYIKEYLQEQNEQENRLQG
uniref:NAD(P)-binding domain-containing protein n=1 Tax=Panagrolaimus sp. JU765 TaxID=591449 RepID=A0AC34RPJ4_9BILA